jgi:hypothetical protein
LHGFTNSKCTTRLNRLTSPRADKYEDQCRGFAGMISPRVTRTVLYSDVSLPEHARLSTIDFKGDFPFKHNIVIHGVRRMHSRVFRFKPLCQARKFFAIFSAGSLRVEARLSHNGIRRKRDDPKPRASHLSHHGRFVEGFTSVPICRWMSRRSPNYRRIESRDRSKCIGWSRTFLHE